MTSGDPSRVGERRDRRPPVPKWVFGCSLALVGLLAVVVLLLTFGVLPDDSFNGWREPLTVAFLVASVAAALASNEIIPWEERKSLATWMRPKALGRTHRHADRNLWHRR